MEPAIENSIGMRYWSRNHLGFKADTALISILCFHALTRNWVEQAK
jgi:hypothetical protein